MTTVSMLNNSSSVDSSGDELSAQVTTKWGVELPREGNFLQKKDDYDDKVMTSGGGKRKSKRERKKAVAANKVWLDKSILATRNSLFVWCTGSF